MIRPLCSIFSVLLLLEVFLTPFVVTSFSPIASTSSFHRSSYFHSIGSKRGLCLSMRLKYKSDSNTILFPSSQKEKLAEKVDVLGPLNCPGSNAAESMESTESGRRRDMVSFLLQLPLFTSIGSSPAYALKERNEALCGTGFFTNIAQYKCTEIGDIFDEGKSKPMNDKELTSLDGLMGKLSIDDDITTNKDQKDGLGKDDNDKNTNVKKTK